MFQREYRTPILQCFNVNTECNAKDVTAAEALTVPNADNGTTEGDMVQNVKKA